MMRFLFYWHVIYYNSRFQEMYITKLIPLLIKLVKSIKIMIIFHLVMSDYLTFTSESHDTCIFVRYHCAKKNTNAD